VPPLPGVTPPTILRAVGERLLRCGTCPVLPVMPWQMTLVFSSTRMAHGSGSLPHTALTIFCAASAEVVARDDR